MIQLEGSVSNATHPMQEPLDFTDFIKWAFFIGGGSLVWLYLLKTAYDLLSAPSDASVWAGAALLLALFAALAWAAYCILRKAGLRI